MKRPFVNVSGVPADRGCVSRVRVFLLLMRPFLDVSGATAERVHFWSQRFCVCVNKGPIAGGEWVSC